MGLKKFFEEIDTALTIGVGNYLEIKKEMREFSKDMDKAIDTYQKIADPEAAKPKWEQALNKTGEFVKKKWDDLPDKIEKEQEELEKYAERRRRELEREAERAKRKAGE